MWLVFGVQSSATLTGRFSWLRAGLDSSDVGSVGASPAAEARSSASGQHQGFHGVSSIVVIVASFGALKERIEDVGLDLGRTHAPRRPICAGRGRSTVISRMMRAGRGEKIDAIGDRPPRARRA